MKDIALHKPMRTGKIICNKQKQYFSASYFNMNNEKQNDVKTRLHNKSKSILGKYKFLKFQQLS